MELCMEQGRLILATVQLHRHRYNR